VGNKARPGRDRGREGDGSVGRRGAKPEHYPSLFPVTAPR